MHRLTICMAYLYLLVFCAIGAHAESDPSAAFARPLTLTTSGPAQVILHDIQTTDQRLTLEIRSSDIVSMPAKSAIHFAFDTPIIDLTQPNAPMPLALETAVADKQVTFFLARDPFAFPQPWSYTITIAFHQLPRTGAITFGDAPAQTVTYPVPSPTVATSPGT